MTNLEAFPACNVAPGSGQARVLADCRVVTLHFKAAFMAHPITSDMMDMTPPTVGPVTITQ